MIEPATALPSVCWHPEAEPRDKGITYSDARIIAGVAYSFEHPIIACETGAFPGTITHVLLEALPEDSHLISYEREKKFIEPLKETQNFSSNCWDVEAVRPTPDDYGVFKLTVIDSSPYSLRNDEIDRWHETASPGATLVVHDVFDTRWRKTPTLDILRGVELGGPWGVGIYRKAIRQ